MRISESDWIAYINRLAKIDKAAADKMRQFVDANGLGDTEALIDYAYAIATRYGEASAALAAEMYDATAEAEGIYLPPAEVADTATYAEVAKTINGVTNWSQNPNSVANSVGRLVKRAGADTTLKNAERDGAQFAWVPHGDTCSFCITLASRGWQYMSKKAMKNGHAEHIHANCDCTYAVRHDRSTTVNGYDPERYKRMYYDTEGTKPQDRINSLRKKLEAGKRNEINAQKRDAYEERTETGKKPSRTRETLIVNNVKNLPPKKYETQPTTEQIIERISGGDKTKGSCSSCALAYAGNKAGYDVLDFRDGNSRAIFSRNGNIREITEMVGGEAIKEYNDIKAAKALLEKVETGKEYYFATGRHAAIIRKADDGIEYLELQSASQNGYKKLTQEALTRRFGARKSHTLAGQKTQNESFLIDIEKLKGNDEFTELLGYINTKEEAQKKGASGSVK